MKRRNVLLLGTATVGALVTTALAKEPKDEKKYTLNEALPLLRSGKAMNVEGFDGYIAIIGKNLCWDENHNGEVLKRINCPVEGAGEGQIQAGTLTLYDNNDNLLPEAHELDFRQVIKPGRIYSVRHF